MADNLDSDGIRRFLQNYRSGAHGYGQASYDGYGQAPYAHYGTDPRWAPPVTHRDVLVLDEPDDSPFDETQSEYMAASTTASTATTSRAAHTSMRSGASSSLFSYRTDGGLSSVGQSTAPSVGVARPTFVQQFLGGGAPPQPNNHHDGSGSGSGSGGGGELWCEFSELLHCPATFALDDEAGWIAHHAAHFGGDRFLPSELVCWFCDDDDKHAPAPFVAARAAERPANFKLRMRHVRRHVLDADGRLTSAHARPDFHVVRQLRRLGRLSEDVYRHAMAYDETPAQFRLPAWSSSSHPSESSSSSSAAGGSRWRYHDLDRERRERRREEQQERRKEEEERKGEARRKEEERRRKEERRKEEERHKHGQGGRTRR